MPIVNVGTAPILFSALKQSLSNNGLDFSKCLSVMYDTTNVMKGARSGVKKLIRKECPYVLDVRRLYLSPCCSNHKSWYASPSC